MNSYSLFPCLNIWEKELDTRNVHTESNTEAGRIIVDYSLATAVSVEFSTNGKELQLCFIIRRVKHKLDLGLFIY